MIRERERENFQHEEHQKKQLINGVFWLSAGNVISRLLGAIYIIPWYAWMGGNKEVANGLFGKGYEIYALLLLISTSGIPASVAKETAYYNSLGEFRAAKQYFHNALKTMLVLGSFCSILMFFGAPILANLAGADAGLVAVMRSLSIAILVYPVMSVIRGFFQGNNEMKPYALSEIFEQIARVFWMLLTTFLIMKIRHGDYKDAVVQSTFAAFIGMLASFSVLLIYLKKLNQDLNQESWLNGVNKINLSGKSLPLKVIKEAIPFVISGASIQIFRMTDMFTFNKMLGAITNYSTEKLTILYSLFNTNPNKLIMIVVAFAISISCTGLPLITENFALGKTKELGKLVNNNLQLFLFIMFPLTFGMMILAHPLNTCFYAGNSPLGVSLLFWSALQAFLLSAVMVAVGILQGMGLSLQAIKYTLIGSAVKLVVQFPCILLFKVYGPLVSTTIGMVVIFYLMINKIYQETNFNFYLTVNQGIVCGILTSVMSVVVIVARSVLYLFLSPDLRWSSFIIVICCGLVGFLVYLILSVKLDLAEKVLGDKINLVKKFIPFL